MALTQDTVYQTRGVKNESMIAKNAAVIWGGSYLMGGIAAGDQGFALPLAAAANYMPLGLAKQPVVGDTVAPAAEAEYGMAPVIVQELPVATLAGDETDNLAFVYATDDGTFTLVTNAFPVGFVSKFKTAAVADVYLFGLGELMVLRFGGAAYV